MPNIHSEEWRDSLKKLVALTTPESQREWGEACIDIIMEVAAAYGISASQVLGRGRAFSEARQQTFYTLRLLGYPRAYIADVFDRDDSTIGYGIKRHEERLGEGLTNGVPGA